MGNREVVLKPMSFSLRFLKNVNDAPHYLLPLSPMSSFGNTYLVTDSPSDSDSPESDELDLPDEGGSGSSSAADSAADSGTESVTEYQTLAHGHLSPRHRRLCFLAAQGKSNAEICTELGYVASRVSILLKNPHIQAEIARLQERIFEETIGARLKSFAEPALANIQMILTDRTNRVKISEKMALSQWVIEKLDGKATQKIEAGENLLASLMDRLDAGRTRPVVNITNNIVSVSGEGTQPDPALDVTPDGQPKRLAAAAQSPASEDDLASWIADFNSSVPEE